MSSIIKSIWRLTSSLKHLHADCNLKISLYEIIDITDLRADISSKHQVLTWKKLKQPCRVSLLQFKVQNKPKHKNWDTVLSRCFLIPVLRFEVEIRQGREFLRMQNLILRQKGFQEYQCIYNCRIGSAPTFLQKQIFSWDFLDAKLNILPFVCANLLFFNVSSQRYRSFSERGCRL